MRDRPAIRIYIHVQVRTTHGLVLVATTHLLSPHLKAGQMNTERRIVQFKALLEKTIKAAGADDMVVTGDFNWNEQYVPHAPTRLHYTHSYSLPLATAPTVRVVRLGGGCDQESPLYDTSRETLTRKVATFLLFE